VRSGCKSKMVMSDFGLRILHDRDVAERTDLAVQPVGQVDDVARVEVAPTALALQGAVEMGIHAEILVPHAPHRTHATLPLVVVSVPLPLMPVRGEGGCVP
jgi:hypothetical protein